MTDGNWYELIKSIKELREDHELYEKLLPYQSSLMEHGRKIVGNGLFGKIIQETVTTILRR